MIVLAIIATLAAIVTWVMVLFANGMRSSPGPFQFKSVIVMAWVVAAILWLAYYFN